MKGIYLAGNFLSHSTGITSVCEELADQFSHKGWHVITASHHQNRLLRMVDLLWTAFRYRNQYQLAAVEVFSNLAFCWAEVLCQLLRWLHRPYILTLHGGKLAEFAQKFPRRVKFLIRSAYAVTTPSKNLLQAFSSIRKDITYIPNGIELSKYPYVKRTAPKPSLIWMHSFHQTYNPLAAVEVLQLIVNEFPDSRLTMIGPNKNDGSFSDVNKLIQSYGLTEKVNFTGAIPKSEVGKLLSQGDIFLNTTNYESFGISTMEAAACGLCIVATDAGELSYLWQHDVDALLAPTNDVESIAKAVRRILIDPGLAERLSENAHNKANNFDWSLVVPQWQALIATLK